MPATQPTAIVTSILDITNSPTAGFVDFVIDVRLLFTPQPDSPQLQEQMTLTVPESFSKQDVRAAAHTAIIASVAEKGATLLSSRIFGVDDLV